MLKIKIEKMVEGIIKEDVGNNRRKVVLLGLADKETAKRWGLEYLLSIEKIVLYQN